LYNREGRTMATRVLIVDDNRDNLYLLESLLAGYGFEVVSAENGDDALVKALLSPPAMIVSDILMPVMDGYALCRTWKLDERLRQIPFVFYTATYTDPKDEVFALSLGAERFILKPQEPDLLMKILKEVLETNHALQPETAKPLGEEMEFFRQHNSILCRKLEKKMSDLMIVTEKLGTLEERHRLTFENVTDVIFMMDADLTVLSMSPSVETLLGYKPEDFINRPFSDLRRILTRESFERASANLSLILRGETVPATIYEFVSKNGTIKYGETNGSPIMRNGEVTGIVSVARDITDRQNSVDQLRKALGGTVRAIASMVEVRDPYTAGHQRRVADLARTIAQEMGLSDEKVNGLRMAGIIHDIGKVSVPAEILSSPRKLSNLEFSLIKTHAQAGYDIIKDIEFPWPIARMILEHHERMNGSGYPNGLTENNILLDSRILAVADVVEAMATHRPYRPSLGIDAALKEITQNKKVLYDPDVVDICLILFKKKGYHIKD
jgi:PAS domain S-box-containing protein/putative nucleotidyltransferase with HDIG domain